MNNHNFGIHKINRVIISAVTALVATTSISAIAQAGTIRHDRSDWQYTNLAASSTFNSVGEIFNNGYESCSGTLVSSMWVLTAAHCVVLGQDTLGFGAFTVGGGRYTITDAVINRQWLDWGSYLNWGNQLFSTGTDIALLKLKNAVQNVTPAQLYATRDEYGKVGTYVGFGNTGNGFWGDVYPNKFDGNTGFQISRNPVKRAGQNVIDGFNGSNILLSDFDDPYRSSNRSGSPVPLNLEYSIGNGDSGGGMFINGKVAGVHSYGDNNSRYGELFGSTRVSSFARWISDVVSNKRASSMLLRGSFGQANLWGAYNASNSSSMFDLDRTFEFDDYDPNQPYQISIFEDNPAFEMEPQSVPEPSTLIGLFLIGGLLKLRRRSQYANQ